MSDHFDKKLYEYHTSFFPCYSNESQKELEAFLSSIGADEYDYYNVYSPDKEYYIQYKSSGHERDSSGDCVTIWKRNNALVSPGATNAEMR